MGENPKSGLSRTLRRGLRGFALALGLSTPAIVLGQWTGGSGTSDIYETDSEVGIGTSTPIFDLHVKGQSGDYAYIGLQSFDAIKQSALLLYDNATLRWVLSSRNLQDEPHNRLGIFEGPSPATERLSILPGGAVGIGTISPNRPLEVVGGLHISGPAGELSFGNRETSSFVAGPGAGERWLWYASGGLARLWSGGDKLVVNPSGKVGIGTNPTQAKLTVMSSGTLVANADNTMALIPGSGGSMSHIHYGTTGDWYIRSAYADTGKVIIQDGLGYVGIGTTNPTSKLTVKGTITAGDVTVSSAWADYVFEEGYELMPLQQVGAYIQQNGRLPGVPSAAEVAAKGVSVSQTQVKLLEKVEELTLYALAMEKENARLRNELTQQKQAVHEQMQSLEQRLAKLENN